jgi:N-acyl-D-aspartate/D-glutamate deacylase
MKTRVALALAIAGLFATSAAAPPPAAYTVLIRGGTIYDGSGGAPYAGDVALVGDKIAYVGPHAPGRADRVVDATGKAVSPGFINMLSWAVESLIADGRGMSDTYQGVTLEVFGEGDSMGPLTPKMKALALKREGDIKYPIRWTSLADYLNFITKKGVTPNVASFVGATGLDASFPPWVQSGGLEAWIERMKDPAVRARLIKEMRTPNDSWENLLLLTGSPDKVLLVSFKNPKLKPLTGKTLAEVARMRGKSPEETAMDLVIEDGSRVGTVYFLMNEDNVRREAGLPWMSFGSDEGSPAPEGVFLKSNSHPRAYGNVARLLGHYVRDEHAATLQDAVRRLTSLPATNLGIRQRGWLRPGYYGDVVVFDPATIQDHATYEQPNQLATGVDDVFVNGVQVLKDGAHTGAKPGRVVRGPGWTGWPGGGACR